MVLTWEAIRSCFLYPQTTNNSNNSRYRATSSMGGKEREPDTVVAATHSGKPTSNNRCPLQPHTRDL